MSLFGRIFSTPIGIRFAGRCAPPMLFIALEFAPTGEQALHIFSCAFGEPNKRLGALKQKSEFN
jgi:hypothetical protein